MTAASIPTQPILTPLAIPTRILSQGDMGIYVDDRTVLISSKSNPGQWRIVDLKWGTCSCEGFVNRGTCRHLGEAREAEILERDTAKPVDADAPIYRCFRCGVIVEDAKSDAAECPSCTRKRLVEERGLCPKCSKRPRGMRNAVLMATCNCCSLSLD